MGDSPPRLARFGLSGGARGLDAVPPELLVVFGALSVQGGASLATALLRTYGPFPVVAMRIGFGAVMLLLVRPVPWRRLARRGVIAAILLGVILAAMNTIFYVSISRIPLGVAVTIEFWGPLSVAVLGSRRPRDLLWVALAAAGIYILAGGRLVADDLPGVAAAFAAGFCWALYIPAAAFVGREWPDGRGLSLAMLVATALVLPVAFIGGDVGPVLSSPVVLLGGVVVAVFSSVLPYTTEIAALKRLRPSTFGVLMSLEPGIAAAVGFLILGQTLPAIDLVAIAFVVLASAGASWTARRLAVAAGELEAE